MNDHDREVALIAGIAATDSLVATVSACMTGARAGAEDELAQLADDDAMRYWESGFLAGLNATVMFLALAAQHGETLRDEYRQLKGMGQADGN